MSYSRALEIVQDEEYLDESDFDEIRLRYRRNIQVNNHNELMTSKKRIRSKRQSEVVTNGKKTFYFVTPLTGGYPLGWGLPSGPGTTLWGLPSLGATLSSSQSAPTFLVYQINLIFFRVWSFRKFKSKIWT